MEIAAWSLEDETDGALMMIHLLQHDLTSCPGWPIEFPAPGDIVVQPVWVAFADFDLDGDVELVHLYQLGGTYDSYQLYAPDLENPGDGPATIAWGMNGHDGTHSGFYHRGDYPTSHFLRGDANRDATIWIDDVFAILSHLFDEPQSVCPAQLDFDGNNLVDLCDAISLLGYLYLEAGAPPIGPFPECGSTGPETTLPCPHAFCP